MFHILSRIVWCEVNFDERKLLISTNATHFIRPEKNYFFCCLNFLFPLLNSPNALFSLHIYLIVMGPAMDYMIVFIAVLCKCLSNWHFRCAFLARSSFYFADETLHIIYSGLSFFCGMSKVMNHTKSKMSIKKPLTWWVNIKKITNNLPFSILPN